MIALRPVTQHTLPFQHARFVADVPPEVLVPRPPRWVDEAFASGCVTGSIGPVELQTSGPLGLLTTSIAGARAMPADRLRLEVSDAYLAIGRALTAVERHPIRFWNFVPDPGVQLTQDLDRYMVFNAGRYDGYAQWLDVSAGFGCALPTASAVGVISDDLVIFCLASELRGTPIENPRQRPAWQYSHRYGPMPPCFSRATIATLHGHRRLLVGGTASIVGEDSQHEHDVDAQLDETLSNLAALIDAAVEAPESRHPLSRLFDLRVYVAREQDAAPIRAELGARCASATRIELALANLCRPELLVEIEGVAEL